MRCTSPLRAYRLVGGSVVFVARSGQDVVGELVLPCGQCHSCRVNRAVDWRARIIAESYCWPSTISACFTYSDENIPAGGSLSKRHVQLALKRLRRAVGRRGGPPLRYFIIAEYSPAGRAHYHSVLFNYLPPDAVRASSSRSGNAQYSSAELSEAWGLGMVNFQEFTSSAADYVSGYYVDKLRGDAAVNVVAGRCPEFMLSSRGGEHGGIGAAFLAKFGDQVRAGQDFLVLSGRKVPVPAFFERRLSVSRPVDAAERAEAREQAALEVQRRDGRPGHVVAAVQVVIDEAKRRRLSRGLVDGAVA